MEFLKEKVMNLTAWDITAIISGVILFFMLIKLFIDLRKQKKQDSIESNLADIYKKVLCKDCYERLNELLLKGYIESKKDSIKT